MRQYFLSMTAFALLLSAAAPRTARADEFKLKDGSTVVGTVVGYQGNSFKVKTSYGYALVEKDKIVSIKIGSAPESSPAKADQGAAKPATEKPIIRVAKTSEEHAAAATNKMQASVAVASKPKAKATSATPSPSAATLNASAATPPVATQSANAATVAQSAGIAANTPSGPPEPVPIREKISGNTYINDTFDFEMYKPPDWQVMDGARSVLPGAVAAMGTDDQSTYLVVGQQPAGKSATADDAAMEQRLNAILVNYRPIGDEHLTVSGEPVVAHRFRGSVDEHDWSGFMVFMQRGAKLYTIFGMTRADDDLVQIQENVLRRAIASFQFLPQ